MNRIIISLDGGTIEERLAEIKEFLGLNPDQSFQDLEIVKEE